MVSKNNKQLIAKRLTNREVPHYSLRKLGIGVVSVLLGTTMYMGANSTVANADAVSASGNNGSDTPAGTTEAAKNTEIQASQVALTSSQAASAVSNEASQQMAANSASAQTINNSAAGSVAQKLVNNTAVMGTNQNTSVGTQTPSSLQVTNPQLGQSDGQTTAVATYKSNRQSNTNAENTLETSLDISINPAIEINGTNYHLNDGDNESPKFNFNFDDNGEVTSVNVNDDNSIKNVNFDPKSKQLTVECNLIFNSLNSDQQPISVNGSSISFKLNT